MYHVGFGRDDLPEGTTLALMSGDPGRSELIATEHLQESSLLARSLQSLLFRVTPHDAPTFAAVAGFLALVTLAASVLPALRAVRIDPMRALRE